MRLLKLLAVGIFLLFTGCKPQEVATDGPTEITVWHPWGKDQAAGLQRLVNRYHKTQNKVRVRLVFTPTDLSTNQKFFTAVAANKPPDVSFVDGTQVAQWAEWNALEPLNKFIERDKVRAEDFYGPSWKQALYNGKVYALTFSADPNFVFCWNKTEFRRAGLDPEKPPRTIEELDEYAKKLEVNKNDRLEKLGLIPWNQYGRANSTFTWGWAFGGHFYDDKTQTILANDPKTVKALEWMTSYAKRLDVTKINASTAGWGGGADNPLITGKLAMACVHISTLNDLKKYGPDVDFGLAPLPGAIDGEIGSSWVGGWLLGLPRGTRHPDEGWDFIHWICATPEGTSALSEEMGILPGFRHSPAIAKVKKDPQLKMFVQILEESKHQRPVMPVQAYFMGALDRAVDRAIYGKQSPKEALDQATAETQRELDLILNKK